MIWRRLAAAFLTVGVAALPVGPGGALHAQTVLTFENFIPCNNTSGNVGVYGGVNFQNQWTCYSYAQPPYTPASGTNRVYTVNGAAPFSFGAPTAFQGAWFSGYSYATVQFQMFLNGNPVALSSILAPSATPTFLSSGYAGPVTSVNVLSPSPDYYVMDDVTFNSTVTPEPGTMLLILSGLSGLGGLRLRRRRQA